MNSPATSVARLRTHRSAIIAWVLLSRKNAESDFWSFATLSANADMTATRRYFGEWTTSECRGDQHDDLHFSRSLHARGHQGDVCEAGGPFRGGRGVVRGRRWSTNQLVFDFGTLRLADHSGSTGRAHDDFSGACRRGWRKPLGHNHYRGAHRW